MKSVTSINELNKIIREQLVKQSELSGKLVLNSLTNYGIDLDKLISGKKYDSYDLTDNVMLFELENRVNPGDTSFTEKDNSITSYRSYTVRVVTYGNNCDNLVNKVIARMRTEKVRNDLLAKGVYIETISNCRSMNEFKNEVIWPRCDFDIDISCKTTITQIDNDVDFDIVNIKIIK